MNDHTSTEIFSEEYCDFMPCKVDKVQAQYDGATVLNGGSWAYMCESHYSQYGTGLGLGMGQRLIIVPRKTK